MFYKAFNPTGSDDKAIINFTDIDTEEANAAALANWTTIELLPIEEVRFYEKNH